MSDNNTDVRTEGNSAEQTPSAPSTNTSLLRPSSMDRNRPSSTAERVFSGSNSSNRGFMCNNLTTNPFTSSHTSSSANGGSILQKSKLVLKPSSFGPKLGETSSSMSGDDSTKNSLLYKNPFLKPAKLIHEPDENESNVVSAEPKNERKSVSCDATNPNKAEDSKNTKETQAKKPENSSPLEATKSKPANDGSVSATIRTTAAISTTLGQNTISGASTVPSSISSTFVFGEHLDERVTNVATENGTSANGKPDSEPLVEKPKTLEEAADEYKRKQESGPLLPEVQTVTGEEGESNVLQISCKLFLFQQKESSWAEKGRGLLRLNDKFDGAGNSRLVMRTAGTLTLLLNTKLWPQMICNRASHKSVQITAMDEGEVHVYLVSGSQSDMDQLYNSINYRLSEMKQKEPQTGESASKDKDESEVRKQEKDAPSQEEKLSEIESSSTSKSREASQKRPAEAEDPSSPKKRKPTEEEACNPST